MKRYFNNMSEKQVIMIEFASNSVVRNSDIPSIFGGIQNIVEIGKSEYRRQKLVYEKSNETNLTMTISR